jgi:hypothetical protein
MDLTELMFWFASVWILPFWFLMWFLPNHEVTHRFVGDLRFCFVPLLIPYVVLAAPEVSTILLTFGSEMPTPEIVVDLFSDSDVIMLGWLHFLAFDMFLGRFIWLRMVAAERPLFVSTPVLIMCMMMAPLGCVLGLAATWGEGGRIDTLASTQVIETA